MVRRKVTNTKAKKNEGERDGEGCRDEKGEDGEEERREMF